VDGTEATEDQCPAIEGDDLLDQSRGGARRRLARLPLAHA
jgi:hypothetical protein